MATFASGAPWRDSRIPTPRADGAEHVNVGQTERWVSVVGGGLLALYGLSRGTLGGLATALAGGVLLYRGASGRCPVYAEFGVDTAGGHHEAEPIRIEEAVTVRKPAGELYAFWRDFERLPQFMQHLASVKNTGEDGTRSHWTARVPGGLGTVEWDAEIAEDVPDEKIAWRSLPDADVHNAGQVRFEEKPAGRGTVVYVTIEYRPPAADLGSAVAGLFNPIFSQMIKEDVRRFKSLMEAGEIPTTEGQPKGT